jgi:monofunctional biosynthetic peptidoglycan transglycosylase
VHGVPRERDPSAVLNEQEPKSDPPDVAPPVAVDETGRHRAFRWISTHRRIILPALLVTFAVVTAWIVLTWPDVALLRDRNPRSTAFIDRYVERSGSPNVAWRPVPASRISPYLKEAVVVAEDLEFFSHGGFSAHEIEQAIREAVKEGAPPRGASTITQQLAKNLWLSPSRNLLRKLEEAILTWQLERHLSKDRILEIYLNVAEFGPGIYGVEAAARHHFGKSAAALWHPGRDSDAYRRYVAEIQRRMDRATFLWRRVAGVAPLPEMEQDSLPSVRLDLDSLDVDSLLAADTAAGDSVPQPGDSLARPGTDSVVPSDSVNGTPPLTPR